MNSSEATFVLSRTRFVVKHIGCPLFWASKIQTETSLSTAEAEHIALSHFMRETLTLMVMLKEIHVVLKIDEVVSSRELNYKVLKKTMDVSNLSRVLNSFPEQRTLESITITFAAK